MVHDPGEQLRVEKSSRPTVISCAVGRSSQLHSKKRPVECPLWAAHLCMLCTRIRCLPFALTRAGLQGSMISKCTRSLPRLPLQGTKAAAKGGQEAIILSITDPEANAAGLVR